MAANRIYIYIYIDKQRQPAILNVDNDTDGAVLEQLGAVKMPENLVAEIFGEQAEFADSTNCTITPNPDNPAFPYAVTFDANKIPEKPKRELGTMAGICMPSEKYIDIPKKEGIIFQAPANGFVIVEGNYNSPENGVNCCYLRNYGSDVSGALQPIFVAISNSPYGYGVGGSIAVKKGDYVGLATIRAIQMIRFVYAEGEI